MHEFSVSHIKSSLVFAIWKNNSFSSFSKPLKQKQNSLACLPDDSRVKLAGVEVDETKGNRNSKLSYHTQNNS